MVSELLCNFMWQMLVGSNSTMCCSVCFRRTWTRHLHLRPSGVRNQAGTKWEVESRGSTQIWKWRTSTYRRTKIVGIQCKISSKKGVIRCGHQKNGGSFGVDSQKIGVIQCAKMQFQGKICKFSVKIATKSLNFSKCARSAQKFSIFM